MAAEKIMSTHGSNFVYCKIIARPVPFVCQRGQRASYPAIDFGTIHAHAPLGWGRYRAELFEASRMVWENRMIADDCCFEALILWDPDCDENLPGKAQVGQEEKRKSRWGSESDHHTLMLMATCHENLGSYQYQSARALSPWGQIRAEDCHDVWKEAGSNLRRKSLQFEVWIRWCSSRQGSQLLQEVTKIYQKMWGKWWKMYKWKIMKIREWTNMESSRYCAFKYHCA